jgi:formimidoylglutamate deiminase
MFAPTHTWSQSLSEKFGTTYDTAKMPIYSLHTAYLPQGWTRDALITVSNQGMITAIDASAAASAAAGTAVSGSSAAAERVQGIVVPGIPNAHSHAFQRAMAGATEYRFSARDSFWTWRQAMYALANRIAPEELQVVATQLFVEMLKAGYTSVAEFHYLHGAAGGGALQAGANPLWDAICNAAKISGIGLTFLPTLYQSSDFGGKPLKPEQARFAMDTEGFVRAIADRISAERLGGSSAVRTGAAFHSLRAVPLDQLLYAAQALHAVDSNMPVHIHVAEQILEVRACVACTGLRPIELLLDRGLLTEHWCVVHATHATADELQGIVASDAVVCVSVSTEANLGDGFFDAARFLKSAGKLCVGSDSQATVSPAEELRWLEYQQRLRKRRRGVLVTTGEPHVGTRLWRDAALHGAQAVGQAVGSIAIGRRADWVVLDAEHSALAGADIDSALDRLVFAGADKAIRDVMVGGRWVIKDGRHLADNELRGEFSRVMNDLRKN